MYTHLLVRIWSSKMLPASPQKESKKAVFKLLVFVKITPDFIDKKAITAAFSVQFVFSVSQKNNHGPDFKYPECRYILSKKNLNLIPTIA